MDTVGYKAKQGFTIVELLIVIVIIAILAAITLVAFNGIQDRAKDSRMASDFANSAKNILLYQIDNSKYPDSSGSAADAHFSFSPVGNNVILCADNDNQGAGFSIVARPTGTTKWYAYDSSSSTTTVVAPISTSAANLCATTSRPALLWGSFWVAGG